MNTPRDTAKLIRKVEPVQYIHIGIAEGIIYTLRQNGVDVSKLEVIAIDYNMNGVQLTDSTDNVFWPIWCRMSIPPFLAGNYYSDVGQPKSFNSYNMDFVSEFKIVMNKGFTIGYKKVVAIRPGGDAPGRCDTLGSLFYFNLIVGLVINFSSGLKHATGYCGCGRCTAASTYIHNRVCFTDLDAPLRTDKSFEDRLQPQHHHFKPLIEGQLGLRCI